MEKPCMDHPPTAYGHENDGHGGPYPYSVPEGPPPVRMTNSNAIFVTSALPNSPVTMQCPICHAHITTEVTLINGFAVVIAVIILLLFGCWLGCCLIPLFIDDLKDVEHHCPQCHGCIGIRKRI